MWKPAKGILLPAKEDTTLFIGNKRLHYNFSIEKRECISQHLYIINDDVIKESDWLMLENKIVKCIGFGANNDIVKIEDKFEPYVHRSHFKKIIATTDNLQVADFDNRHLDYNPSKSLPYPTTQFIQLFVDAVNKTDLVADGGLISLDVLVEYDFCVHAKECMNECQETKSFVGTEHEGLDMCEDGCGQANPTPFVKVNSDNSINIKLPSKENFTRQEYEAGLREAFRAGNRRGYDQRSKMAGAEGLNEPDKEMKTVTLKFFHNVPVKRICFNCTIESVFTKSV